MKKATIWILGLSCLGVLGNGQDGAVATTPPPDGWGVQGNTAWTKAQHEAELEKAAALARQQKALKQAMGSYAQAAPPITTAEQFLAAHRPPAPAMPPPGESPSVSPVRRSEYVPAFETAPPRAGRGEPPSSAAPAVSRASGPLDLPRKRVGFFDRLKGREEGGGGLSGALVPNPYTDPEPVPASSYTMPTETPPAAADLGGAPAPPLGDALAEATRSAVDGTARAKPSLFGKLFGKDKTEGPGLATESPVPVEVPVFPSAPPAPVAETPVGIPAPPDYGTPLRAPAPPSAAEGGGSIFVSRGASNGGGAAGATATVLSTTQATVDGVLVRLYENSTVTVLERGGSMVRIRLADGREGTVAASALSR